MKSIDRILQRSDACKRATVMGAVLMVAVWLALSSCQVALPAGRATPSQTSVPTTVIPSPTTMSTPQPTPTATLAPTPTPTPIVLADAPASLRYTLPLTVQHVTATEAVLFFELESAAQGIVLYWPVDDLAAQQWVALEENRTRHQIALSGLSPGTAYQAIVGLGPDPVPGVYRQVMYGDQLWDPVSFCTMSDREPLHVGVVGDSGFGEQITYELASEMATYDLDFVIHTGDVVYNIDENASPYVAYMLKWYLPFAPLLKQMPVYPVVGNHDVEAAAWWNGVPFYYTVFPPFDEPRPEPSGSAERRQWYAFGYRDVQFVMLDTQTFYGEEGRAEQEAWLTGRLTDPRYAHTIVTFHVPPYTSGRHTRDGLPVQQAWAPLFETSNVRLVLSGHDHNYERLTLNGITYVVSGGGSGSLYAQTQTLPGSAAFARQTHFVLLKIYANRIDLAAIALGGEVLDQATIPLE